jgi:hypothetical protein
VSRLVPALLLTLLALAPPAHGQGKVAFGGSEVFRFALYKNDLQPLSNIQDAFEPGKYHRTMIVLTGDSSELDWHFAAPTLRHYVSNGGAVLIATDGPTRDDWLPWFGFRITGERLSAPPADCYNESPQRPFVTPLPIEPGVGRQDPDLQNLFANVPVKGTAGIATHQPSEMVIGDPRGGFAITKLAQYPDTARRISDGQRVPLGRNHFAVGIRTVERGIPFRSGRMIILADSGVFANGMMGVVEDPFQEKGYSFDNGNWEFANRTIQWLQGGRKELRTHCLFIQDGKVIDEFAIQVPPAPKPPVPKIPPEVVANILLNHANGLINEKQEQDVFNQTLLRRPGLNWFLRYFLGAMTILFLFAAFRWLTRAYRKTEPATVLTPAARESLLPRGGVLRQRNAAQLEVGNLFEAARRRVRDRFDVLGGRPGPDGRMPPLLIANDHRDPNTLRQLVGWVWGIGYGESPVRVSPVEWDQLNITLERVTAQAARGDWSFAPEA